MVGLLSLGGTQSHAGRSALYRTRRAEGSVKH